MSLMGEIADMTINWPKSLDVPNIDNLTIGNDLKEWLRQFSSLVQQFYERLAAELLISTARLADEATLIQLTAATSGETGYIGNVSNTTLQSVTSFDSIGGLIEVRAVATVVNYTANTRWCTLLLFRGSTEIARIQFSTAPYSTTNRFIVEAIIIPGAGSYTFYLKGLSEAASVHKAQLRHLIVRESKGK
jgi:hypothetical protein